MSYAWDYDLNVLKIVEENGYYPFGLKHSGYNADLKIYKAVLNETKVELKAIPDDGVTAEQNVYNYKYNGKELQDELGLNIYTYGFRDYIHDYKPNPNHPEGKPIRQPGREPKPNELSKDKVKGQSN